MLISSIVLAAAVTAASGIVTDLGEYSRSLKSVAVKSLSAAFSNRETKVSGIVTFAGGGIYFVQSGDDGLKVRANGKLPRVRDIVEVSGHPTLEGGRITFIGRGWRKLDERRLPEPRKVGMDELVSVGVGRDANATRVVLAGRVIGPLENGFAIDVGGLPVSVMAENLPPDLKDSDITHPKVIVRGVCELVLDQFALFGEGEDILGVKLHLASESDLTLVPDLAYLMRKRDRNVRFASVTAIAVLALIVAFVAFAFFRQRRRLFRTRTLMAERKRMADDIHDTIEQHLVGAKMLVALGRTKEAQDVLVRAKAELRDVIWGLKNDDMMRLSPADMLRKIAADETKRGIVRVDVLLSSGLPAQLAAAVMRDLSLIVRESIGNAIKHGGAKHIAISSNALDGGGWRLSVSNDGEQFDPAKVPGAADGHFGIEGMRERARRIGITLEIKPRKQGMVLVLEKS